MTDLRRQTAEARGIVHALSRVLDHLGPGSVAVLLGLLAIGAIHTTATTTDVRASNGASHAGIAVATSTPVCTGPAAPAPAADILGSPRLAAEAAPTLEEAPAAVRTFQTYTKTNPVTGEVYVGRTSGFGTPAENLLSRDASHAYNARGFGPATLDQTSDSLAAIRGREQQLIDYYRLQGNSANAINGVSPFNRNWMTYMQAAWDAFGAPGG